MTVAISVNGEPRQVPETCTIAGLLTELGFEGQRVAVAVNRDVVPRSEFGARTLAADDRVEILHAVGGGAR